MNNVLFEIGLEELPARFIDNAEKQLTERTEQWLKDLRISYQSIESFATPRRLAILIHGISEKQSSKKEEVRGPSEEIAKDQEGNWTKAAIGFTKGQGKTTDDIYIKDIDGKNYIFIENYIEGKPTYEKLPSFQEIIESIQFPESMHWDSESIRYARPIRWLVALYNEQIIPFEIAHVETGNQTYGHRFLGTEIILQDPLAYEEKLKENYVIANAKERETLILKGIRTIERENNFQIIVDEDLLQEVRNLIEYPTVFYGNFEEEYLTLPREVLITSMKEHQRYFPVQSNDRTLLPYFIGVRNGDQYALDNVVKGNEKVLRARLSDGQFFYEEDQKQSISNYQDKLKRVVFHEKLGTISEKVKRVENNVKQIAETLKLDDKITKLTKRAAEISKFDLMTNMVNEFPELQGIMGGKYALRFGEDKNVAQAIKEHYLPVKSTGELPDSIHGSLLSIADKLDTVAGIISIGLMPTGSQDPYSLRRQAIGILRILQERNWQITIEELLKIALNQYDQSSNKSLLEKLTNFFKLRATYLLKEKNIEQDVIEAVFEKEIGIYSYAMQKATILSTKRNNLDFKDTQEALVRVLNLSSTEKVKDSVDTSLFETTSEEKLYDVYQRVHVQYYGATEQQNAQAALMYLSELAEPIHSFFDNNMVMADDEKIKKNRLTLVSLIATLITDYANLSVIQWKQHT